MRITKTLICIVSLLLMVSSGIAQTNPQMGYIVTNANDTIEGTINDRYAELNARRCTFMVKGQSEYHDYLPGQIHGYQIYRTGDMYVTLTANVNGQDSTFFALQLVEGRMSLYCLPQSFSDDLYFFSKDGKLEAFDSRVEKGSAFADKSGRRAAMAKVMLLGNDSKRFSKNLWGGRNDRQRLIDIVQDYNFEMTGDPGYTFNIIANNEKVQSIWSDLHFMVMGGMSKQAIQLKEEGYSQDRAFDTELTGSAPVISIGASYHFSRLDKNLIAEALITWMPLNNKNDNFVNEKDSQAKKDIYSMSYKSNYLELELGASYRFGHDWKVQPLVRAGGGVSKSFSPSIDCKLTYADDGREQKLASKFFQGFNSHANSSGFFYTLYAGAGVAVPLPRGTILLYADYCRHAHPLDIQPLRIRLGYEF